MPRVIIFSAIALASITFLPHVFAADSTVSTPSTGATTLPNPLRTNSVQGILYLIADIGTYIGVIVAVLALIYVGFKFVAARGNPEKITEAKTFLFYVIIGVAILIGASAIIDIVKNTLTSAGVVQPGVFTSP